MQQQNKQSSQANSTCPEKKI